MVILAITTAFVQGHRSNEAAAKLRAMVHTTASVRRIPSRSDDPFSEIPMERLVPGDVVRLSAGDMIPGDLRLLEAKGLFINQSALTGASMPAERHALACDGMRSYAIVGGLGVARAVHGAARHTALCGTAGRCAALDAPHHRNVGYHFRYESGPAGRGAGRDTCPEAVALKRDAMRALMMRKVTTVMFDLSASWMRRRRAMNHDREVLS